MAELDMLGVRQMGLGDGGSFADLFREAWADIVPSPESAARGVEGCVRTLWHDPEGLGRWQLGCWDGSTLAGVAVVVPDGEGQVLEFLAVRDGYRSRGVGSMLLSSLFAASDRPTRVRTWDTNTAALAFYCKHGFREVSREPDHRGPGVGSVWLSRGASGE